MNTRIEQQSRARIAAFLPDAIRMALNSYQKFSHEIHGGDDKSFKEHHMACKVAISHIDLLLKLARWADLPDSAAADHNQQQVLMAAIAEAERELHDYEEQDDAGENRS
ncbi:MAG: hypothetical protein HYS17_11005 [Micavibrio aeruginosavorus]|uniref:Uncharacterized protein n=1 Tax=Micavibrio aeruginosavorus TaxID=349221 RepID=A0A7T5R1Z1_9BACT|nr:MAG: hypothetical protein HYS17_11005 [Micavibrio aeruginosavorus]